mmetsp:Transcript_38495/g.123507  ORF Transcript_38495/g.123507 Transcript_38495/m.123507 type:complete len:235 (-) Transcript_38495:491-1195(-)
MKQRIKTMASKSISRCKSSLLRTNACVDLLHAVTRELIECRAVVSAIAQFTVAAVAKRVHVALLAENQAVAETPRHCNHVNLSQSLTYLRRPLRPREARRPPSRRRPARRSPATKRVHVLCLAEQQAVVRTCCNRNHPDALKRVDDAGCQLEALCHLLLRLVPVTRRDEERVWVVPNLPAISCTEGVHLACRAQHQAVIEAPRGRNRPHAAQGLDDPRRVLISLVAMAKSPTLA